MSGPSPDEAAIRLAVRQALSDLYNTGGLVLVACSGGPDSLALAAGTAFEAAGGGFTAGAVVVDHAIQPASDAVATQAAAQCQQLGLAPVVVKRLALAVGPNLEARARNGRYAALEQVAAETNARAVLLGHTMDDQAETVLLALARGSGAAAVAGMPTRRGIFRRPLLGLRRSQTNGACLAAGLEPWNDPMNRPGGPHYSARAELRATALPALVSTLGPGVVPALARTAQAIRTDTDYLDTQAEEAFRRCQAGHLSAAPTVVGGLNPLIGALDAGRMAALDPAIRLRVWHRAALAWGATPGDLGRVHILALDALVTDWHGQGPLDLPGPLRVARRHNLIGSFWRP